jgi:hypothetical protein
MEGTVSANRAVARPTMATISEVLGTSRCCPTPGRWRMVAGRVCPSVLLIPCATKNPQPAPTRAHRVPRDSLRPTVDHIGAAVHQAVHLGWRSWRGPADPWSTGVSWGRVGGTPKGRHPGQDLAL